MTLISVVIIGRNEGERLRHCLESVAQMQRTGFNTEVIYVDSNSSDHSMQTATDAGAMAIALTQPRTTAAMGRNAGWRRAQGSIILFLDGDTVLAPDFVARSLPQFDDAQIAVVWGHRRETRVQDSLYNRVLDLDWIYAPGLTSFCGGDALFRRSVLEATGGFDESLIAGEEPELCRRITAAGGQILHVDLPMTGHDLAITRFSQYWRRATRAGHAFAEVSERFRNTPDPFWLGDAERNQTRALILIGAAAVTLLACVVLRSGWPLLIAGLLFVLLVVRTARRASWKTHDRVALGLYGIHSQLQQIPVYVGQLQFRRNRKHGVQTGLVEYKQ